MTRPDGLRPETIWKLLEHEGFQILIQNGYDTEQDERPCVRISSPMNSIMVSIAIRGGGEAWCQKVFDGIENGEKALSVLLKEAEPMMAVLQNPPLVPRHSSGPTDILDTDLDYLRNPIPKTER